jgi:hypothetical protein
MEFGNEGTETAETAPRLNPPPSYDGGYDLAARDLRARVRRPEVDGYQ